MPSDATTLPVGVPAPGATAATVNATVTAVLTGFDGTFENGTDGANLSTAWTSSGMPQHREYDDARAKEGTLSAWIQGPATAAYAGVAETASAGMAADGAEERFWLYADTTNQMRVIGGANAAANLISAQLRLMSDGTVGAYTNKPGVAGYTQNAYTAVGSYTQGWTEFRIVYDFAVGYHLGTMERALLLRSMVPLYMAYYWAPQMQGMTMRFLLPLFPGFAIAAAWMLHSATAGAPRLARVFVPATVVAVQLLWGGNTSIAETANLHHQQRILAMITDELERVSKPGDTVIASNAIEQHLDFVRQWKLVDLGSQRMGRFGRRLGAWAVDGMADRPSPMQAEKMRQRLSRYEGLTDEQRQKLVADEVLNWAGGGHIFYIGSAIEMMQATSRRKGSRWRSTSASVVGRAAARALSSRRTSQRTSAGDQRGRGARMAIVSSPRVCRRR